MYVYVFAPPYTVPAPRGLVSLSGRGAGPTPTRDIASSAKLGPYAARAKCGGRNAVRWRDGEPIRTETVYTPTAGAPREPASAVEPSERTTHAMNPNSSCPHVGAHESQLHCSIVAVRSYRLPISTGARSRRRCLCNTPRGAIGAVGRRRQRRLPPISCRSFAVCGSSAAETSPPAWRVAPPPTAGRPGRGLPRRRLSGQLQRWIGAETLQRRAPQMAAAALAVQAAAAAASWAAKA